MKLIGYCALLSVVLLSSCTTMQRTPQRFPNIVENLENIRLAKNNKIEFLENLVAQEVTDQGHKYNFYD